MFLYRLALAIGEWDVEQTPASLSSRITIKQLQTWMAFYRIEPFGQDWWRSARLAATLGGFWSKSYPEQIEETFLPTYRANRTMTDEEMLAELRKAPQFAGQLKRD